MDDGNLLHGGCLKRSVLDQSIFLFIVGSMLCVRPWINTGRQPTDVSVPNDWQWFSLYDKIRLDNP